MRAVLCDSKITKKKIQNTYKTKSTILADKENQ